MLTQLLFPKPPTTFLTCFCRGERRKYARKKSRLKWGSNSQPPGHESDTLTTEPPGSGQCASQSASESIFEKKKPHTETVAFLPFVGKQDPIVLPSSANAINTDKYKFKSDKTSDWLN